MEAPHKPPENPIRKVGNFTLPLPGIFCSAVDNSIFPDPAMTLAAVDRLVHHATIFEMNVESYRRRTAEARRAGPGRPANFTTTLGNIPR
jgi:hypothetical protein